jgi:hypothetical protein
MPKKEYYAYLQLPPEWYGALLRFLSDRHICPDLYVGMVRRVPELLIACGITLNDPGAHDPECGGACLVKRVAVYEDELQVLLANLPPESAMATVVQQGLDVINAAKTVEEINDGMQAGDS